MDIRIIIIGYFSKRNVRLTRRRRRFNDMQKIKYLVKFSDAEC